MGREVSPPGMFPKFRNFDSIGGPPLHGGFHPHDEHPPFLHDIHRKGMPNPSERPWHPEVLICASSPYLLFMAICMKSNVYLSISNNMNHIGMIVLLLPLWNLVIDFCQQLLYRIYLKVVLWAGMVDPHRDGWLDLEGIFYTNYKWSFCFLSL